MAEYRIRATGQTMLEDELRRWAKETTGASWNQTTDEVLEALGADAVFEGPQPMAGRYQIVYRDGVEQTAGKWYTKYSVADLDADAIVVKDAEQAKNMRAQRNQKLKDSDWSQVADAPVDKAVWAAYRQALRDVPAQAGFPWDINWPVAP
jgi:hypothetical protein